MVEEQNLIAQSVHREAELQKKINNCLNNWVSQNEKFFFSLGKFGVI
jgi:hypothetical protein